MQQSLAPREHFPILQTRNYLASHSLGAMPRETAEELQRYAELWARDGILAWEGEWWDCLGDFARRLARILNAPAPTLVPCLNVTLGFATIASCLRYTPQRNRIVLCDLEFTTTQPFWEAQAAYGAELVVVPSVDGVQVAVEDMEQAIDERTCLVVSSHAYFRSGALQDVDRLQRAARQAGCWLVVDAYQSAGCVPIDLGASDFDFLVGGCHKWLCGGPGGGYVYVRPQLIERLEPTLRGWFGLADPFAYTRSQQLNPGVMRFLNGTPNVLGVFAARAGLDWVEKLGMQSIRSHSQQLTEFLRQQLEQRGYVVKSPADPQRRNGMICFDFAQVNKTIDRSVAARACQAALQERGIIVDYRPDCGIRVSPHFYNQLSDLEGFFEALDAIRNHPE